MSDTMDLLKELLSKTGDEVMMGEPDCVVWKADHDNCKGCPHGLACSKLVRLGLSLMTSSVYKPVDFTDFQKMTGRVDELQSLIIGARLWKSWKKYHAYKIKEATSGNQTNG